MTPPGERRRPAGFHRDKHSLSQLGRAVLDAWLFDLIPATEDCTGWDLGRMQALMVRVEREWDQYGYLPSRLPPDLLRRHGELYERATVEARARGWDPELGDDE